MEKVEKAVLFEAPCVGREIADGGKVQGRETPPPLEPGQVGPGVPSPCVPFLQGNPVRSLVLPYAAGLGLEVCPVARRDQRVGEIVFKNPGL